MQLGMLGKERRAKFSTLTIPSVFTEAVLSNSFDHVRDCSPDGYMAYVSGTWILRWIFHFYF